MKLTTARAVIYVGIWLLFLCAIGHADTAVLAPGGFCRVTPRSETDLVNRSLVVCRWTGNDETGDGVAEIVQTVLLLNRKGDVDCSRSQVSILDITRPRYQVVRWYPAC
jgi:hypothetical protein